MNSFENNCRFFLWNHWKLTNALALIKIKTKTHTDGRVRWAHGSIEREVTQMPGGGILPFSVSLADPSVNVFFLLQSKVSESAFHLR